MDTLLFIAMCIPIALYLLWIFFLAVMNLQRARDTGNLSRPAYVLGLPVLWIGYLLDFIANVTIFSVILLDLPREWTVTARLNRMIDRGAPWQSAVACYICVHLLDAFDPNGVHCKHCKG